MRVLNLREMPEELMRALKVEAFTRGMLLRDLCIEKLRGSAIARERASEPTQAKPAPRMPERMPTLAELEGAAFEKPERIVEYEPD